MTAKQAELRAAEAKRNAILHLLKASTDTLAKSAAEVTKAVGVGGLTARPSAEIAAVLSEMQARFLDKQVDQAYISTCLIELGHRKVATLEDKKFRDAVFTDLMNGKDSNEPIGRFKMEAFFLGSHLADENQLTQHCRANLERFVEISIENRHELDSKRLEIEKSRVALLTKQAVTAAARKVIHPSAALNRLKEDLIVLMANRADLNGLPVPAAAPPDFTANEHTVLDKSKAAQLLKLDGLIGQAANATTGTSESEVNNLEARYLSLVADVRKDGTAIQKKLWKADFDKQQAQAEEKDTAMTKLSRELQAGTEESVGLIEEIKAVTP